MLNNKLTSNGVAVSSASTKEVRLGAPGLSDKSFKVGSGVRSSMVRA